MWSETCGTAFYKIVWDYDGGGMLGKIDGKKISEGDVKIICCSPFEIYPDLLTAESIDGLKSLIHAKAVCVKEIEDSYGITVEGQDFDEYTLALGGGQKNTRKNHALVIERYEKPNKQYPNGRLIIVAGGKLVHMGELPYVNGEDGQRAFPFVAQAAVSQTGCFFGVSIIERLIPVQRAYNAVKNRKHEFLNRISMGVLTVEDGSVDTDELLEEGLSPGKVLVYRQGSRPPQLMATGSVPSDFAHEEERLLNEFVIISGVSEISRNSLAPTNVSSGVALQLLLEQDDTRLTVTAENIRKSVRGCAKQILRLMKQFVSQTRMMKMTGEGKKVEVYYFKGSDISSDDVVFDTENELNSTPAQKKSLILDLLKMGLLSDENGVLKNSMRAKVLEVLGYGGLDNAQDITALQINRAEAENLSMLSFAAEVEEYDDHAAHIDTHIRFILSAEFDGKKNAENNQRFKEHLKKHKLALSGLVQ